jgi:hypothetical protein
MNKKKFKITSDNYSDNSYYSDSDKKKYEFNLLTDAYFTDTYLSQQNSDVDKSDTYTDKTDCYVTDYPDNPGNTEMDFDAIDEVIKQSRNTLFMYKKLYLKFKDHNEKLIEIVKYKDDIIKEQQKKILELEKINSNLKKYN